MPDIWETDGWRVDARRWPLLLLELRDGLRDDVTGYGEALYAATRQAGPFASVTVLSFDPRSATPRARQQFAEAVDRAFEGRAIAEAVVSPTLMLRGIVTAHGWLRRQKAPLRAFRELDAARTWVERELRLAGRRGERA